jgi:hypothetical protein
VRQTLEVLGIAPALYVKPAGVLVAEDRLWYGADVSVQPRKPAAPRPAGAS